MFHIDNNAFYGTSLVDTGDTIHIETGILWVNNHSILIHNYSSNDGFASITAKITEMYYRFDNCMMRYNLCN